MDILKKYNEDTPTVRPQVSQWQPPSEYGFFVRMVMRVSGGRIRELRQASYVLLIGAIVITIIAAVLFLGAGGRGLERVIPVNKIMKKRLPLFINHRAGFTLVELLVVISIIGLLSSIVLASLNSARTKARDVRRRADLKQLQLALELYFDANGSYPVATGSWMWAEGRCTPTPFGWVYKSDYTGANAYIPNLAPTYIPVLPGDPRVDPSGRCYGYFSDGNIYRVMTHFGAEGPFDPNDPMIRLINSCTTAQNTFFVANGFGKCF